jgi:alpha-L-fucosidase
MKKYILFLLLSLLLSGQLPVTAQEDERYVPETDPLVLKKLDEWQDLKFGLLMHWGTYSPWGIVESWSICSEDEPWCKRNNPDYVEYKVDYENLQATFNPVDFDPGRWAKAAKNAGMKYVVFTTKHHDGFCMFDTKLTDYKITSRKTPFHTNPGANIAKEVFNAFRAEGLWAGAYFSKPDWHSEYYWWPNFATPDRNPNYDISKYPERWENFVQFTQGQIMELVGGDYGKLDILWLDGGQVQKHNEEDVYRYIDQIRKMPREDVYKYIMSTGYKYSKIQSQDIRMDELVAKVREKQPGMIVVDRAVYGRNQNYLTPENRVPDHALPYPWESCIVAGESWSWKPDAKYISSTEAVHMLVDIVIKGGNLLLNIGPGPQGQWHDEAYKLLEDIGTWMKVNGEAIYGTRALAPYKEGKVCISKKGDHTQYIYYLADENEQMPDKIMMSNHSIPAGAKLEVLGTKGNIKWQKRDNGFLVSIPEKIRKAPPSEYVWVIKVNY